MGNQDIEAATDYLIASHQHEDMVAITFPLLVLYTTIMLRYADQRISSEKFQQVQRMYAKLLHSVYDTHKDLDDMRKGTSVRDDWPVPEYAETIWGAAYYTSYISDGKKGSKIYKKYSKFLINHCFEQGCEQAMTRFLDKGIYLKKDDPGREQFLKNFLHDEFSVFKHFIQFSKTNPIQMHNFTRDLYDTFIAGSVALLAFETLKNGDEGVRMIEKSISDHMEGLNEELTSWIVAARSEWRKHAQKRMNSLLSSKLNVYGREEVCTSTLSAMRASFNYVDFYCLCYDMYYEPGGQIHSIALWNEFRLNYLNYSNDEGKDMMVCFYIEEWTVKDNTISGSDTRSVQAWLQNLEYEVERLVADDGLPTEDDSHCAGYELAKLKDYLKDSTLETLFAAPKEVSLACLCTRG